YNYKIKIDIMNQNEKIKKIVKNRVSKIIIIANRYLLALKAFTYRLRSFFYIRPCWHVHCAFFKGGQRLEKKSYKIEREEYKCKTKKKLTQPLIYPEVLACDLRGNWLKLKSL